MTALNELKERLKDKSLVIGTEKTIKNLRLGKIEKVLLSSNCPDEVREIIQNFGEEIEVIGLEIDNQGLGVFCKKPFLISVIGFLKRI